MICSKLANIGYEDFEQVRMDIKLVTRPRESESRNAYLSVGFFEDNYLAQIRGKKYAKSEKRNLGSFMFVLAIRLNENNFNTYQLDSFDDHIKAKAKKRELTAWDVFKTYPDKTYLQVSAYGYVASTGVRKTFYSKELTVWDLEATKKFESGSLKTSQDENDFLHDIDIEIKNAQALALLRTWWKIISEFIKWSN
ncbi:MAG: hypothetical protein FWC69_02255 [Defluviitaleaceae bacterium]|nr:hypothetical protein [Defluviitaleaceae bacterium]